MAAELKELSRKRGVIKAQLTRLESFIHGFTNEKLSQIPTRLEKCGDWWNEFENIQFQIETLDDSEDQLLERDSFENAYFDVVSRLKALLNLATSSGRAQEVHPRTSNTEVKLPVMEIPTFYGSYKEWLEFYDTFNTLVDSNESLTDIQKFYYLKNSLKGNAANVIHSLEVSATNYKEAWVLLKERFENRKLIALDHIESLYNFTPILKECHIQLRKFLDEVRKDIRALKTLGLPIEHWDTLLIYFLEMKLDPITKREWQRQGAVDKFATMEEFIKFLTHRCQLLETMNAHTKKGTSYAGNDTKTKTEKVHTTLKSFVVSDNRSCPVCKEAYHALHLCKVFLDLSVASKREEVRKANLCWNCLKYGHRVQKCTFRGCRHCGKKHNSLLHVEQSSSVAAGTSGSQGSQIISEVPRTSTLNLYTGNTSTSFDGHSNAAIQNKQVSEILLSTAMVKIADQAGIMHECRALLDSGSQSSFMTKEEINLSCLQKR